MLHRNEIIEKVKKLDLPINEYWITAGAALVIHGIKSSTRDIDLGCSTKLCDELVQRGFQCKVAEDYKRIITINDSIELFENWFVDEIKMIDELPVGSLESIKKQKMKLARKKDLDDIKMIDDYLKKQK